MELGISSIPRTGDEKLTENVLEVEGLRVHFDTLDGPIEALHSVDLKVKDKQIMGLVGESGCGKSVTSLVTIGLATCDVDEGSVGTKESNSCSATQMRTVGFRTSPDG
jgi:ABC-type dipeptide/oligopeptide/nickel transport system ATPase component